MKHLCVFCGSSLGTDPAFAAATRELGQRLALAGWGLVYGGARCGLMGIVADAVMEAGGNVIGVIPKTLQDREIAHRGISQLHVVESMHDRKALMVSLSDAFVALPGGFGTLDELCEVLTWKQLGLHSKPCAILNVSSYYDAFLAQLDHGVQSGLCHPQNRNSVIVTGSVDEILSRLSITTPEVGPD
jgi:uncharacterized protein (TIGR00730 family)